MHYHRITDKEIYMEKKNLMTYFLIPIVMVIMFLTIMISLALFTPKNCVVKIYAYTETGDEVNMGSTRNYYYRSPKAGMQITGLDKVTTNYVLEGYYFEYNTETKEFSNKIPDTYKFKENITIYAKYVNA